MKTQPPLPEDCGPKAREIHKDIVSSLSHLCAANYPSPLDPDFVQNYRTILGLIESYQLEVLRYHDRYPTCSRGCSTCCNHWVVDVNSFEIELIADRLIGTFPERVDAIIAQCREDEALLETLEKVTAEKYANLASSQAEQLDEIDVLLASYYQFRRPCPLLVDGCCSVYDLRPLTCRIYFSFSDPARCAPDCINGDDTPTFLLDVNEDANSLFDQLHFKYQIFDDDTGLRSLLAPYLKRHGLRGAS